MTNSLTFTFADDGAIPNSRLPLLVYRNALPADAAAIEKVFAEHHWPPAWRNGVFKYHHFHSNAHEALGIARGTVSVLFGGPGGDVLTVQAGDLVVIPAGVGHCNQSQSDDLLIVGAYPDTGPSPDAHRGKAADHDTVVRSIAKVPMPGDDPIGGALLEVWK